MSTSLATLETNIAKAPELGFASGTCSAAGTTLTIVDTSTDSPFDTGDPKEQYQHAWAKITADSAASPLNVGEVRRVKTYTPGSQTITTSMAFSNGTTTTQSYALFLNTPPTRVGILPGLDEWINQTLRECYYHDLSLLTLITDGDMETAAASNWTASNATLSKVTAAANVWLGKQALRVLNTLANGYAESATVNVTAGQVYHVRADVRVASGTATLQLYDKTNGAVIDTAVDSVERGWRYLWYNGTIPTSCKQVSVRLVGTEATADVYWDNVSLRQASATEIALPSWITSKKQVEELYEWHGGTSDQTNDSVTIDQQRRYQMPWWEVVSDPTGQTPYRIEFSHAPQAGSLLIVKGLRPYGELSADTDTTDANADMVKAGALGKLLLAKDNPAAGKYLAAYFALHGQYSARWEGRLNNQRPY